MCLTRLVKYDHLHEVGIAISLVYGGGIEEILDFKQQKPYYSDLVRIFYANMPVGKDMILTAIKGEYMSITPALISAISGVQNSRINLD